MTSGVYLWQVDRPGNVPVVYVGQASDFEDRWRRYESDFRQESRPNRTNRVLWAAVRKYGNPVVSVLEECSTERLTERELAWYRHYKGQEELGLCRVANLHEPMSNPMNVAELREQHRARMLRLHGDPEFQEAHREGMVRRSENPEWRAAQAERARKARGRVYPGFVSPRGEVYRDVEQLTSFCKEHGLSLGPLCDLANGKRKSHKGWTAFKENEQ